MRAQNNTAMMPEHPAKISDVKKTRYAEVKVATTCTTASSPDRRRPSWYNIKRVPTPNMRPIHIPPSESLKKVANPAKGRCSKVGHIVVSTCCGQLTLCPANVITDPLDPNLVEKSHTEYVEEYNGRPIIEQRLSRNMNLEKSGTKLEHNVEWIDWSKPRIP